MKKLEKEELKGIDSSTATIKKWDEFLRTATYNLGYKKDLMDRAYPYDAGIPMKDDTTMPVNAETGRVFFKMSWAEKLAGLFSTFYVGTGRTNEGVPYDIQQTLLYMWRQQGVAKLFFEDLTEEEERIIMCASHPQYDSLKLRLLDKFCTDSDIFTSNLNYSTNDVEKYLTEEEKQDLIKRTTLPDRCSDGCRIFFIFYKPFENKTESFKPIEKVFMEAIFSTASSSTRTKVNDFSEVYLQDYLVISLNPIDKLMLSTKQAFGSCMSIAKQSDVNGTNSTPAFGLPALFTTDTVYLTFLTPGKHKNMYWEKEEWEKVGEERDKEKAYKYLKMTCRALTYKGVPTTAAVDNIHAYAGTSITEKYNNDILDEKKERLFIGRQYSARGEDFTWQVLIEVILDRHGIRTGMSYANRLTEINTERRRLGLNRLSCYDLRQGDMIGRPPIEIDRFGLLRGVYFDNLTVNIKTEYNAARSAGNELDRLQVRDLKDDSIIFAKRHKIKVSNSRMGSGTFTSTNPKPGLDMFKLMLGKQNYTMFNSYVKICTHCGKLLEEAKGRVIENGVEHYYCLDCIEKLEMKVCEACGEIYKPEDADKHEIINMRELTNPNNYEDMDPVLVCKHELKQQMDRHGYICLHCGRIDYGYPSIGTMVIEFKGMSIKVGLDYGCLQKAVMCDKCKKLFFLEDIQDAMLLLPNRRIICPDCIDTIRMKQDKRNQLKNLISKLTKKDVEEEHTSDQSPLQNFIDFITAKTEHKVKIGNKGTLLKDVSKQIISYLRAHPELEMPTIKASVPPDQHREEVAEDLVNIEGYLVEVAPF